MLFLVLVVGGRIHPRALGRRFKRVRQKSDPVTQPVEVNEDPSPRRLPNWVNRLHWTRRDEDTKTLAFLSLISESDSTSPSTPIPITSDQTSIGSDPKQAALVVDDPSVEPLHASLVRRPEGTFRLADQGSAAGTWVNYTPVSQGGTRLEHGDLVHIGGVGFRFTLRKPTRVRKPVVTVIEPDK